MTEAPASIWQNRQFRSYLSSTAFSGIAFSMQQLLLSWVLIGILELPADQVGMIQAATGIPGLFLMLLGGASADRRDPRDLLISIYAIAPVLPLFLVGASQIGELHIWSVMLWGLGMSVVTSYSSPAQQAILNRIAGQNVQKAVTASTAAGYLVQMLGLAFAGQMDRIGLEPVLFGQAVCVGLGALAVRQLEPGEVPAIDRSVKTWQLLMAGFRSVYQHKTILHVLGINFISSIFNAGAFMTVLPFIIKRLYEGDALTLASMMIVFFGAAAVSNVLMFRIMPIARPGRVFLIMQLTRVLLLAILWLQPDWWLFVLMIIGWGLNMGVTSTLARTIVQESAEPEFRARVMSVYSLGLLGSSPLGALVLGHIIEAFGTINALIPAMCVSTLLFLYGVFVSSVFGYRSPQYSS